MAQYTIYLVALPIPLSAAAWVGRNDPERMSEDAHRNYSGTLIHPFRAPDRGRDHQNGACAITQIRRSIIRSEQFDKGPPSAPPTSYISREGYPVENVRFLVDIRYLSWKFGRSLMDEVPGNGQLPFAGFRCLVVILKSGSGGWDWPCWSSRGIWAKNMSERRVCQYMSSYEYKALSLSKKMAHSTTVTPLFKASSFTSRSLVSSCIFASALRCSSR